MSDGEQNNGEHGSGPEKTKALVTWAFGVGGAVLGLNPMTATYGVAVGAAAPLAGTASERVHRCLSELKARRVEEVAENVKVGLDHEGLGDRFEDVGDVITEAIPIIADAETNEKRKLIADIIVNAARLGSSEIIKAEALRALSFISEMSPSAVIVYAEAAARSRGNTRNLTFEIVQDKDHAGLNGSVALDAASALEKLGLFHLRRSGNPPSQGRVNLTPLGSWLCEWIVQNPVPADRSAQEG
jgi:hypothetical protein